MKLTSLSAITVIILSVCGNRQAKAPQPLLASAQPILAAKAGAKLPRPAHVVVLILENHSFSQIFGSKHAPNFNVLANGPYSVLFTQSFAIGHPSQPNYLALFSGDTQGSTDDEIPGNNPFTTPNLASELMAAGYTFAVYSENLPSVGYNGKWASVQKYARKHNPVPNWVGKGLNQIPASTNQPFTAFPSSNFDSLPTVCFVVPNQDNDMHDGSVAQSDKWYAKNLVGYQQWAASHNSLLIVTFDEDDNSSDNHITTIFSGAGLKPGKDSTRITHYSVLCTIEDFYHLPHAGHAADAKTISDCWN